MCLKTIKGPFKAGKDIECYKWFKKDESGNLVSPYKYVYWPKTGLTSLLTVDYKGEITYGLHAFINKKDAKEDAEGYSRFVIRKMIIPKGSTYYRGKFHNKKSIAADKMVFAMYHRPKKK